MRTVCRGISSRRWPSSPAAAPISNVPAGIGTKLMPMVLRMIFEVVVLLPALAIAGICVALPRSVAAACAADAGFGTGVVPESLGAGGGIFGVAGVATAVAAATGVNMLEPCPLSEITFEPSATVLS